MRLALLFLLLTFSFLHCTDGPGAESHRISDSTHSADSAYTVINVKKLTLLQQRCDSLISTGFISDVTTGDWIHKSFRAEQLLQNTGLCITIRSDGLLIYSSTIDAASRTKEAHDRIRIATSTDTVYATIPLSGPGAYYDTLHNETVKFVDAENTSICGFISKNRDKEIRVSAMERNMVLSTWSLTVPEKNAADAIALFANTIRAINEL